LTLQPTQETGLSHSLTPAATADGDWESVEACRKGSLAAFDELYQRHGGRMKSIACNLMGNPTDAEDAVQEAFLKIYRNVKTFRGQSSFSTWVYRPRQGRAGPHREGGIADVESSFAFDVGKTGRQPRRATASRVSVVRGGRFQHSEIAEILEISKASSKHALFEAKRELRDRLKRSRIVRTSDEA
jgi:hypothetical protein